MFFALIINSEGIGIGSHSYMEQPSSYPANEIACSQIQAQNPTMYQAVNGVIQESLPAAKSAQKAILQASYLSAINAPVTFKNAAEVTSSYPSGKTVLVTGDTAQGLLAKTLAAGSAAWTLGKWVDVNNVAQTFTFSDLQGLASAIEAAVTLDYADLVGKFAEVDAATTVSAVQAITL